jgi:hypothetical protein
MQNCQEIEAQAQIERKHMIDPIMAHLTKLSMSFTAARDTQIICCVKLYQPKSVVNQP